MTPKPETKKPHNPKHRTMSFKKAQRLRDEAEAALIEDMERHADMEMEQAAELDAAIQAEGKRHTSSWQPFNAPRGEEE